MSDKRPAALPIDFTLINSARRTVCIQVRPDGSVVVRAPFGYSKRMAAAFVLSRYAWIEQARKKISEKQKKAGLSGENAPVPFTEEELRALKFQAKKEIPPMVKTMAERIGVTYGKVFIKAQRTVWGSCSSKGNLNFNCLLMLLPEQVRRYVIVHELCHRKEMNHSAAFWREVAKYQPTYRQDRKTLRTEGEALLQRNIL